MAWKPEPLNIGREGLTQYPVLLNKKWPEQIDVSLELVEQLKDQAIFGGRLDPADTTRAVLRFWRKDDLRFFTMNQGLARYTRKIHQPDKKRGIVRYRLYWVV